MDENKSEVAENPEVNDGAEGEGPFSLGVRDAENILMEMFEEAGEAGNPDALSGEDEDEDEDGEEVEEDFDEEDDPEGEPVDLDEESEDGVEDDDEDPEEDPTPEEGPTYTVTVAGEEIEVTLDEALSGYMRQQDYTQKSMANAETKKLLRQRADDISKLEQEYEQNLALVGHVLTGGLGDDPDWNAVKSQAADANEFKAIREAWMERQDQIKGLKAEMERVMAARNARLDALKRERVQEEAEKLRAYFPEWIDPKRATEDLQNLGAFAETEYGVSRKEFGEIYDARIIRILRDAQRGHEMGEASKKGDKVLKRTRKKSTTMKPGSRNPTSGKKGKSSKAVRAARERLARGGGIRDAETVLTELFMDE